ncbi:recombinase family protein [Dorea sp.]
MKKKYGYIRVSTKDQNPERQYQAMGKMGVDKKNIYEDKMSGYSFSRPAYKKMIKRMKSNDVLVIKSIDRLGRNYSEILEQWRMLTKEKKIDIQVIDMPLLNTDSENNCVGEECRQYCS